MLKLVPDEPALMLRAQSDKVLIIADLHLGFEKSLSSRGVNIPSQTNKLYSRLKGIIEKHRPNRLLILGDVKHGTSRIVSHEWVEVPNFLERAQKLVEVVEVVRGNHDGGLRALLPRAITVHPSSGVQIRAGKELVSLLHGHAWPSSELLTGDVMVLAHNHPTIELREYAGFRMVEPVWVTAKWNKEKLAKTFLKDFGHRMDDPLSSFKKAFGFEIGNPKIILMPAFNPLLGGKAVNSSDRSLLGPLLSSGALLMDEAEVYLLDGSYLGHLSDLVKK